MKSAISFDDVLLKPQYSEIESRKDIDLSVKLGDLCLSLPVISSPMDTITEADMSFAIDSVGGIGIIHRYNTIEEQSKQIHSAHAKGAKNIGAAVGVTGDYLDRAKYAAMAGASVICVDIAHGHHHLMKNALKNLNSLFEGTVHIMAGNVATLDAFNDLSDWGANSIRVGIGGGSICSTRIQTGHGVPTLQSIIDCARSDRDAILIADGGIKNSGDIVKAIGAGADFVMLGSLLSGTEETPVEKNWDPNTGSWVYPYRGMASVESQIKWRGHASSVEGVSSFVKDKGSVLDVLQDLEKGLRSGMSYSGTRDIRTFQSKSTFIQQTPSGQVESSTHINRR
jgi:IMP dehydrogenase